MSKPKIEYKINYPIKVKDIIELLESSEIKRPTNDENRIDTMYRNANLIISAWHGEMLVGLARSLTDFVYCCYLSDLAVRKKYQKQGIGKRMVEITREKTGDKVMLILLAAPAAIDYYPRIGMEKIVNGYVIYRTG